MRWIRYLRKLQSAITEMVQIAWRTHAVLCVFIVFMTLILGVLPILSAWVIKVAFDAVVATTQGGSADWGFLSILLGAYVIILVLNRALPVLDRYLNVELGRKLSLQVQQLVYQKINAFPGVQYFENPRFHDHLRLAEQGVHQGPREILGSASTLGKNATTLIGFAGTLFALAPMLGGLVALAALPQLVVEFAMGRQRVQLAERLSPLRRRRYFYGHLLSSAQAAKEVRIYNLGSFFLGKLIADYEKIHHEQRQYELRGMRWNLAVSLLAGIVSGGAFLIVINRALQGAMSVGDITLFLAAVSSVSGSLVSIARGVSKLDESALFFDHFKRLMSLPPLLAIAQNPSRVTSLSQGIELRDVWFRYKDSVPWLLRGVNLSIPKGKCVAIVGANGSGKTTLVKLLARLYDPDKGTITWDGVDLTDFDHDEYRTRVGMVFQDFMRYDMTVRENIGVGSVADIGDIRRIQCAANQAGIASAIESSQDGYETVLSRTHVNEKKDSGAEFSGGQWQKIAIARAFMRDAELLILDEPTAALDAESEYSIYKRFAELTERATTVLISHRFSTIKMADLIAVLEQGKIVEYGTHDDLIARQGKYFSLYNMQTAGVYQAAD